MSKPLTGVLVGLVLIALGFVGGCHWRAQQSRAVLGTAKDKIEELTGAIADRDRAIQVYDDSLEAAWQGREQAWATAARYREASAARDAEVAALYRRVARMEGGLRAANSAADSALVAVNDEASCRDALTRCTEARRLQGAVIAAQDSLIGAQGEQVTLERSRAASLEEAVGYADQRADLALRQGMLYRYQFEDQREITGLVRVQLVQARRQRWVYGVVGFAGGVVADRIGLFNWALGD